MGNEPCLISGDFNAIIDVNDRVNGATVTLTKIKDFIEFTEKYTLFELKSIGQYSFGIKVEIQIQLLAESIDVLVMVLGCS